MSQLTEVYERWQEIELALRPVFERWDADTLEFFAIDAHYDAFISDVAADVLAKKVEEN
jgi:hypothetical protein